MAHDSHEHGMDRRSFVAGVVALLGGVIAAIIGIPAIGYLLSPGLRKSGSPSGEEWVPLGKIEELVVGEPKLFSFTRTRRVGWETTAQSYGIYVVRKPGSAFDVFSNVCTHLSCRVNWKEDLEEYICPCHDGHFGIDGSIISGPQPRPLDSFDYRVDDGTLVIQLTEA
jgi:menaquinol-cytochrome c reductase iron-sulfur subunit